MHYILDCVSNESSYKLIAEALPEKLETPPQIITLLPAETWPRKDVTPTVLLCYTAFGKAFTKFGSDFPAIPSHHEYAAKFWALSRELLASGQIKPHPLALREGGLAGIPDGYFALESPALKILTWAGLLNMRGVKSELSNLSIKWRIQPILPSGMMLRPISLNWIPALKFGRQNILEGRISRYLQCAIYIQLRGIGLHLSVLYSLGLYARDNVVLVKSAKGAPYILSARATKLNNQDQYKINNCWKWVAIKTACVLRM